MSTRPDPVEKATPPDTADVEGHALPVVIGVSQLSRTRRRSKPMPADDALPRLSKPFPRLRDQPSHG